MLIKLFVSALINQEPDACFVHILIFSTNIWNINLCSPSNQGFQSFSKIKSFSILKNKQRQMKQKCRKIWANLEQKSSEQWWTSSSTSSIKISAAKNRRFASIPRLLHSPSWQCVSNLIRSWRKENSIQFIKRTFQQIKHVFVQQRETWRRSCSMVKLKGS